MTSYKELIKRSRISTKTDSSIVEISKKIEQRCIESSLNSKNVLRGSELTKKVNQFRTKRQAKNQFSGEITQLDW